MLIYFVYDSIQLKKSYKLLLFITTFQRANASDLINYFYLSMNQCKLEIAIAITETGGNVGREKLGNIY